MASVTSFTKDRLQEIEDTTVVGGSVNDMGNLILATREGIQIDAGYVRGKIGDTGPDRPLVAGIIQAFGGSTPPSGWLFCNGNAVSRTIYSELFAAIGTTYGSGDGALTFNVPDLRGRVPVGFTAADAEFNALGKTGGEKTHVLTEAEMPSHTHTVTGKAGTDNQDFDGFSGGFAASDYLTPYDQLTSATGGGAAHNNLQPYNTVHYLISTGNVGANNLVLTPAEDYVGRGSTAQRDSIFGVPGDDNARVALANRRIIWYNTDLGWEETYFAAKGKPGLAVPSLVLTASSGWYPTKRGPMLLLEPPTQVTTASNTFMAGWALVRRRGGVDWFTATTDRLMQIKKYGRYEVRAWTIQQAGTGVANYHLRIVASDGTTIVKNIDGNAFPLDSGLYTRAHMEVDDIILEPGQQVGVFVNSGTLDVHVGAILPKGQFLVRYIGPPLDTES